jgi:hypothetical protein
LNGVSVTRELCRFAPPPRPGARRRHRSGSTRGLLRIGDGLAASPLASEWQPSWHLSKLPRPRRLRFWRGRFFRGSARSQPRKAAKRSFASAIDHRSNSTFSTRARRARIPTALDLPPQSILLRADELID